VVVRCYVIVTVIDLNCKNSAITSAIETERASDESLRCAFHRGINAPALLSPASDLTRAFVIDSFCWR